MQAILQKFGNKFQEEVTQMQAENLEETITIYFNRGLTIQKIHHYLKTSHSYNQSLQSLKRKLNTMKISRHTMTLNPKRWM
ncbi:hypothetical protein VP01_603g7 [Puccinia sorghi]|uniref:Uncharacterized protein n=1 Tax=Puccinia sorghi TaxID=27349 RepID=A0A0L6UHC0_9BASI|nr:hypothetical protein VP01_603g7 [Puccinia sorghi]